MGAWDSFCIGLHLGLTTTSKGAPASVWGREIAGFRWSDCVQELLERGNHWICLLEAGSIWLLRWNTCSTIVHICAAFCWCGEPNLKPSPSSPLGRCKLYPKHGVKHYFLTMHWPGINLKVLNQLRVTNWLECLLVASGFSDDYWLHFWEVVLVRWRSFRWNEWGDWSPSMKPFIERLALTRQIPKSYGPSGVSMVAPRPAPNSVIGLERWGDLDLVHGLQTIYWERYLDIKYWSLWCLEREST